jgi:ribose transport system substrate-binding protein
VKTKMNYGIALAGILSFCLLIFVYVYWSSATVEDKAKISVVLEAESSENWEVLRKGMDTFARENEVEISYVLLTGKESIWDEMEILRGELQKGAEGMLLNLQNKDALTEKINDTLNFTKVVMIESPLSLSFEAGVVAPDNAKMGKNLGELVKDTLKAGEQVGIITGNIDMQCNRDRLAGVKDTLGDRIAFIASTPEGASKELWEKTDKILCLDSQAGELSLDGARPEQLFYVIGRSERLVYELDKGTIDTLLVADEFVMGYSAMKSLYEQIRNLGEIKDEEVPYIVVNRSNLYEEENERILFPSVQ